MIWRFKRRDDGPQPPTRQRRGRHREVHEPCREVNPKGVATHPSGRFYTHSPCDSNTAEIKLPTVPDPAGS